MSIEWVIIVAWIGLLVAGAIAYALALCRISSQADRTAQDLHRQAAQDLRQPPKEAA